MRLPAIAFLTLTMVPAAFAGWGVSVQIGGGPYYGYAPRYADYARRYIPGPEMRRVFVVARYARVEPDVVVDYYRRGYGWDSVCAEFGVPMDVLYERDYVVAPPPVYVAPPPVYGYYGGPRPVYRERYYVAPRPVYRPEYRGHERGYDRRDWDRGRREHDRGPRGRW